MAAIYEVKSLCEEILDDLQHRVDPLHVYECEEMVGSIDQLIKEKVDPVLEEEQGNLE